RGVRVPERIVKRARYRSACCPNTKLYRIDALSLSAPARRLIEGSHPLRVVLEVTDSGLVRWVCRHPLRRLAAPELPHPLPERNGRARVVTRARGELHADAIRLGLMGARMRQRERHVEHGLRQLGAHIAEPERRAEHANAELLGHLLARALAPVL